LNNEGRPDLKVEKRSWLFYGWIVAVAAFLIVVVGYGMRYGFSVFYVHILQEFGWTRAGTAMAFSWALIVYGLSAPVIGFMVDKLGPRRVVPLGAIVLAFGLSALSRTSQIWHLYIFFGFFVGLGISLVGNASFIPVISNWFVRRRGTAMGIYFAGVAGAPAIAPLVEYVISLFGWRNAYLVLAGLVAAIIIPTVIFVIRTRPQDKGLLPDGDTIAGERNPANTSLSTDALVVDREWVNAEWAVPQAIKTRRFWGLFLCNFFIGIQINMLYLHQVAHVVDIGFSQTLAASILGIAGFANMAGNVCGFISDRIGREWNYTVAMIFVAMAIYALILINDTSQLWLLYVYAILFGFFQGNSAPAIISAHADIFMGKNFGTINGLFLTGFGIGGFIGPLLGGWVFDVFQSYLSAFYLAFALAFVCIAMMWLAGPRQIRMVAGVAKARLKKIQTEGQI
jgi:MFS family permease